MATAGCKSVRPHGPKLGCGEQGCTYEDGETSVVKITKFGPKLTQAQWTREARIGAAIGALGVAPEIYRHYVCKGHGYIEMQKLRDAKRLPDGTVIRAKDAKSGTVTDHVDRMPAATQIGFLDVLRTIIDAGFVHMDNHIENLGFVGRKPVIFDFGFTQERRMGPRDKALALGFSACQVIEHCAPAKIGATLFWATAMEALQGQPWPVLEKSKTITTVAQARALYGSKTLTELKKIAKDLSNTNTDLALGLLCYASLLTEKTKAARYDSPLYDVIYKIRQGKKVL